MNSHHNTDYTKVANYLGYMVILALTSESTSEVLDTIRGIAFTLFSNLTCFKLALEKNKHLTQSNKFKY